MPHYCCVRGCHNSSESRKDLSWHGLPRNDGQLLKIWTTKIGRDPRHFNVTKHTKICSEHFLNSDFIEPESVKKRLKKNAVPSVFKCSERQPKPEHRTLSFEKLNNCRPTMATCRSSLRADLEKDEETDTSSEAEAEILKESQNKISQNSEVTTSEDCSLEWSNIRLPPDFKALPS